MLSDKRLIIIVCVRLAYILLADMSGSEFINKWNERYKVTRMKKLNQLYEGKAKKVFETEDPDVLIVDYKRSEERRVGKECL